ncbi:hypothetical protein ACRALDRAFT_213283 [Sodiomyces alcalophilus JCM 7366]|uniref:uncharacterized protein n=1 Tax=Sodiomyces alcalophilus JCM 7366 TaxID=591952 RepID=UPI0039B3859B
MIVQFGFGIRRLDMGGALSTVAQVESIERHCIAFREALCSIASRQREATSETIHGLNRGDRAWPWPGNRTNNRKYKILEFELLAISASSEGGRRRGRWDDSPGSSAEEYPLYRSVQWCNQVTARALAENYPQTPNDTAATGLPTRPTCPMPIARSPSSATSRCGNSLTTYALTLSWPSSPAYSFPFLLVALPTVPG